MNYGLYLAAGGVLTNMFRQDVVSNNLANSTTVGFKPDEVYFRQRLPQRLESGPPMAAQQLLERLGGAQMLDSTRITKKQGGLSETGNALDVAIKGDGFLVVGPPGGSSDQLRLTRDGQLALNAGGELVMASNGMRVLDSENRVIRLDRSARIDIQGDGDIVQDGEVQATIRIAVPSDPDNLVKTGDNLLRVGSPAPNDLKAADGQLVQRHVESSAVDPITALNDLVKTAKAVMGNAKMMQFNDYIMGQAVNTMGRVA